MATYTYCLPETEDISMTEHETVDEHGLTYEAVQKSLTPAMREVETVKGVIETAAQLWPDRQYMTDATTGASFTFGETNARANEVAHALASTGVTAGDRVGLHLVNSPEYVTAIYGCTKIGAVQTPINWQYREREVRHAIDTADISTILVQPDNDYLGILDAVVPDFEDCVTVVVLDGMTDEDREYDVDGAETVTLSTLVSEAGTTRNPDHEQDRDDPVSILYTSGTTGMPKPALHTNESYLLSAKSFLGAPLGEDDVNYNPFPLFHANNQCYGMLAKTLHGSGWVFADSFSGSAFFDHVVPHDVTSVNILGGVVQMLLAKYDEDSVPDNDLDLAIGPIGDEQWDSLEALFDLDVVQIYSQTENPVLLMNYPALDERRHGAIGKPMFPDLGHEVKFVEDRQEVPVGETGELLRTDVGAMAEYVGLLDQTAETIQDGWLHSGDIAREDEDGFCYYVDRRKFMVRRAGENISAREVENVIDELDGVEASAIFPAPHTVYGEVVKVQVKRSSNEVLEEDIITHVGRELAPFKVPRYVEFVDEFPRTPSERIQRVELANAEQDRDDHGWDREVHLPDWKEHV